MIEFGEKENSYYHDFFIQYWISGTKECKAKTLCEAIKPNIIRCSLYPPNSNFINLLETDRIYLLTPNTPLSSLPSKGHLMIINNRSR